MPPIQFLLRKIRLRPTLNFAARHGWVTVVLFLASLAAPVQAQERIQLAGSQGSGSLDVWLTTSDRTVQNGLSAGSGVIHWTIGGKSSFFGQDFEAPVPYTGLEVSGTAPALKATGGKYTLTSDAKAKNILKTGLDLTVKKNAVIEGSVLAGKRHLKFTGNAELKVGSKSGNLGTLQRLEIDEDGGVYLEGTAHLTEVPLLVATVVDANVHFNFDRPASGTGSDSFTALTATIAADLPDVLSSDAKPLLLSVKELSLDRDFNLTFKDGKTLSGSTALRIPLVRPAGFALLVTSVSDFDVATGTVTNVELKSDLCLPPKFKDAQGGEAVIKNIDFKYNTNGLLLTVDRPAADLDIRWDNFKLVVPKGTGTATTWTTVVLDLDPIKANTPPIPNPAGGGNLPPAWTGFYLKEATLHLPDSLKGSGAPAIAVQNFMLDANGLSGSVAVTDPAKLSNLKIPGFAAATGKVTSLKLGFVHTHLSEFAAKGTLKLAAFDATIAASVALSDSGAASVALDPSEDVEIESLGLLLAIDRGSVAISAAGKATVDITGSIKVPDNAGAPLKQLAGTQVSFAGLKLNDKGAFSSGSVFLDVPSPVTIDMGPAQASISQIGFGQDHDKNAATDDPWVKLTGDVAIEGLPTSGGIGFEGLTIFKQPGAGPGFTFGGIHLDIRVENVGRLELDVVSREYPDPTKDKIIPKVWQDYMAAHGKKIQVLYGGGGLSLDCFGDPGPGIDVEFLAAKTGWFGKLNVQLDASKAVQLGSTPFLLFGFQGGLGYNVIPASDGAKGVPGVDYDLVPQPPGSSNNLWLFTGGVRVGTQDGYLLWGDVVLTAQFGAAFWVDLDSKLYVMTDGIGIGAPPTNPSKYIHGNLHYDGPSKEFTASVTGEFYFPDRANPQLTILGSTDIRINPALREIRIGKDVKDVPGSSPEFTDPVLIKFGAVTGQGVLVLRNDASSLRFKTGAALSAKFGFDEVTVLKVITVSGSGQIAAFVYLDAAMAKQNGKWRFDGAHGHMGLSAAITLSLEAKGLGKASVLAGVDADLAATLDSQYAFSASGSVRIYATAFKQQISLEPQFSYQGQ